MRGSSKLFSISIILIFFCFFSVGKVFPGWFKHYGWTNYDYGESIQQTSDGGSVVAGYSLSFTHGDYDFALYKLDSKGNK